MSDKDQSASSSTTEALATSVATETRNHSISQSPAFVPLSQRFRAHRKEGTGRTLTSRLRLSTASLNSTINASALVDVDDDDDGGDVRRVDKKQQQQQHRESSSGNRVKPAQGGDHRVQQMRGIFEGRGARTGIKFNTSQIARDEDGFFDVNDFFAKTRRARIQHIAAIQRQESGDTAARSRRSSSIYKLDADEILMGGDSAVDDLSAADITSTSLHTTRTAITTPGSRSITGYYSGDGGFSDDDGYSSYMSMTTITDDLSSVSSYYHSEMDEEVSEAPSEAYTATEFAAPERTQTPSSTKSASRIEGVPPAVAALLAARSTEQQQQQQQQQQSRPGTPILYRSRISSASSSTAASVLAATPTISLARDRSSVSATDSSTMLTSRNRTNLIVDSSAKTSSASSSLRRSSSPSSVADLTDTAAAIIDAPPTPKSIASKRMNERHQRRKDTPQAVDTSMRSTVSDEARAEVEEEDPLSISLAISPIHPRHPPVQVQSPGFSPYMYRPPASHSRRGRSSDSSIEPSVDIIAADERPEAGKDGDARYELETGSGEPTEQQQQQQQQREQHQFQVEEDEEDPQQSSKVSVSRHVISAASGSLSPTHDNEDEQLDGERSGADGTRNESSDSFAIDNDLRLELNESFMSYTTPRESIGSDVSTVDEMDIVGSSPSSSHSLQQLRRQQQLQQRQQQQQQVERDRQTVEQLSRHHYRGDMDDDDEELDEEDEEDDYTQAFHTPRRPHPQSVSADEVDDAGYDDVKDMDAEAQDVHAPDISDRRDMQGSYHADDNVDMGYMLGESGFGDYDDIDRNQYQDEVIGTSRDGDSALDDNASALNALNLNTPIASGHRGRISSGYLQRTPHTPGLLAKVQPHTLASVRRDRRRRVISSSNYGDDSDDTITGEFPYHKTSIKERAVRYRVDEDTDYEGKMQVDQDDFMDPTDESFAVSGLEEQGEAEDDDDSAFEDALAGGFDANDLSVIHRTDTIAAQRPKRKRVPPLQFWRHERLDPAKKHILRPKTPTNNRKRKARTALKPPGPIEKKRGRFPVVMPDGEERHQTVVRTAEMVMEDIIEFDGIDAGELGIVSYFANPCGGNWRSGVLKIYPQSEKPPQSTKAHTEVFHVTAGSARVQINRSAFIVRRGSQFFVPPYNTYSITNNSDTQICRLVYFSMGGTSPATNASTINESELSTPKRYDNKKDAQSRKDLLESEEEEEEEQYEEEEEEEFDEELDDDDDDEEYMEEAVQRRRGQRGGSSSATSSPPASRRKNRFYKGTRRRKRGASVAAT